MVFATASVAVLVLRMCGCALSVGYCSSLSIVEMGLQLVFVAVINVLL
jgi:hypothetical protein